jgi:hypothetical protein
MDSDKTGRPLSLVARAAASSADYGGYAVRPKHISSPTDADAKLLRAANREVGAKVWQLTKV